MQTVTISDRLSVTHLLNPSLSLSLNPAVTHSRSPLGQAWSATTGDASCGVTTRPRSESDCEPPNPFRLDFLCMVHKQDSSLSCQSVFPKIYSAIKKEGLSGHVTTPLRCRSVERMEAVYPFGDD